ncbi:unnamed protein product [Jaminaea pallidilutea]
MHLSVSTVQRAFETTTLRDSAQAAVDDLERFGLTVSIDEQGLAGLEDRYGDEIWPAAWVLARVGMVAFEYINSLHMNSPRIENPKVFASSIKDSKRTQRAVDAKAVARVKLDEVMAIWRGNT